MRICQSCRNETTHATCTYCRRYRRSAGATESGAAYCVDCGPDGEAWHDCPECGQVVRGAGNGRCRACINRSTLEHDARLTAVAFSGTWSVQLLEGFVRWLLERDGASPKLPAMLRFHRFFFSHLDRRFTSADELHPQALLDLFTVAGLRRHELAVRYLSETINLEISEEDKQEHAETARVNAILERALADQWSDDLFQFNLWLVQNGRSVRTRRLYLSSAAGLMRYAGVASLRQLDQRVVAAHLATTPGSRANLSSVVRFARERLDHEIGLPDAPRRPAQQPKPLAQLRALLKKIEAAGDWAAAEDLEKIIAVAFGIPHRAVRAGVWWPERRNGRWHLVSSNEVVVCPPALHEVVVRWNGIRTMG